MKKILNFILLVSTFLFGCANSGGKVDDDTPHVPIPPKPDPVLCENISVEQDYYTFSNGGSFQIKPIITPSNATNKKYEVSIEKITSYDFLFYSNETFSPYSSGLAKITYSTLDGSNLSTSFTLHVKERDATKVTLDDYSDIVIKPGEHHFFSYSTEPVFAATFYPEFSNPEVAELEQSICFPRIVIIGKNPGETLLSLNDAEGNCLASVVVKVPYTPVSSIAFKHKTYYLHVGETKQTQIEFYPNYVANKNVFYSTFNPDVATIYEGVITAHSPGTARIKATSEDGFFTTYADVIVEETNTVIRDNLSYDIKDFSKVNQFKKITAPTKGRPKMLIIPIWFSDSNEFIKPEKREIVRDDIRKAYLGSEEETGWESVKTYYEKDSNCNLIFDGVVSDWYETELSYKDVGNQTMFISQNQYDLLANAVKWYKENNHLDNLNEFDLDRDDYIDIPVFIYAAPDYSSGSTNYQNLWAYCSWYPYSWLVDEDNGMQLSGYCWASYDFMYDNSSTTTEKTGAFGRGCGDNTNCIVDSHCFIHEMGHILGLNDYYDYAHNTSPTGYATMQDNNVGTHDPYSKMLCGWVDPYVVTDSTTITIDAFTDTGDVIMVTNKNNYSPFDEYVLVELYTPDGLNEVGSVLPYRGAKYGSKTAGIRLWHVDARLAYYNFLEIGNSKTYYDDCLTNPGDDLDNLAIFMMVNSSSGDRIPYEFKDYAACSELYFIRNEQALSYRNSSSQEDRLLFHEGDTFNTQTFYYQFFNKGQTEEGPVGLLNSGEEFNFEIHIDSIVNRQATITITKH